MSLKLKIFSGIIIMGIGAMVMIRFGSSYYQKLSQKTTSDAHAVKSTITIGVDSWIGYYPLCSREFKKRLRADGYLVKCNDDKADYQKRFKDLKDGKLQFAVATVDSYLLGGGAFQFPGTIIAVIDESKGGDAIVGPVKKFKNLESLKNAGKLRLAYTPNSPSEFLLRAVATHFDLQNLELDHKNLTVIKTDGSEAAYGALIKNQADIAVLWEPYVRKAINQGGYQPLLSSNDTKNLIVDILLVNRDLSKNDPQLVRSFLGHYFRTLKFYRGAPEVFLEEIGEEMQFSKSDVEAMLHGVAWQTLTENARKWFGLAEEGVLVNESIIDAIDAAASILVSTKAVQKSPVPEENPYILLNKQFLENLYRKDLVDEQKTQVEANFSELSEEGWSALQEVGTLKIRPLIFQSGTNQLSPEGMAELKGMVEDLSHYPNFRIIIKGHTGLRGDPQANIELSKQRAEAVKQQFVTEFKFPPQRMRAVGLGATMPLKRRADESDRAYDYRLPRVEISLVKEAL